MYNKVSIAIGCLMLYLTQQPVNALGQLKCGSQSWTLTLQDSDVFNLAFAGWNDGTRILQSITVGNDANAPGCFQDCNLGSGSCSLTVSYGSCGGNATSDNFAIIFTDKIKIRAVRTTAGGLVTFPRDTYETVRCEIKAARDYPVLTLANPFVEVRDLNECADVDVVTTAFTTLQAISGGDPQPFVTISSSFTDANNDAFYDLFIDSCTQFADNTPNSASVPIIEHPGHVNANISSIITLYQAVEPKRPPAKVNVMAFHVLGSQSDTLYYSCRVVKCAKNVAQSFCRNPSLYTRGEKRMIDQQNEKENQSVLVPVKVHIPHAIQHYINEYGQIVPY